MQLLGQGGFGKCMLWVRLDSFCCTHLLPCRELLPLWECARGKSRFSSLQAHVHTWPCIHRHPRSESVRLDQCCLQYISYLRISAACVRGNSNRDCCHDRALLYSCMLNCCAL